MSWIGRALVRGHGARGVLAAAFAFPLTLGGVPVQAQGIFSLFRGFSQPVAPAPQPLEYQPAPLSDQPRRRVQPRPKPVPAEQTEVKKPIEPRPMGEIDNPVPALLADKSLRAGDMVMFPDGLRVFTGRPEGPHKLTDFKPVAQAGKTLSRETRKLVQHLIPGENIAWSTDGVRSGGKLAANTKNVDRTGSIERADTRTSPRPR